VSSVTTLYTPEVLALATQLAQHRLDDSLALRGSARSASCGSSLTVGLSLDDEGRISRIGLAAQACAIGQASAALMAAAALGKSVQDFTQAEQAIALWLTESGPMPTWPGLDLLAPAKQFPARHGAILLGWRAVGAAFAAA
jgi:NifU-like protein involved in Fe-S cluster formation